METIRGKKSRELNLAEFKEQLASYNYVLLDLGTGDGRYVHTTAEQHPGWFVIGVDACRENLREHSRAKLDNMLFIIAEAQHLPQELTGLISHVTINFPWGSLLQGLLAADRALMEQLAAVSHPGASAEIHLNSGALSQAGTALAAGAERIRANLSNWGWLVLDPQPLSLCMLRAFPSTWARRLASGRDPRAVQLNGWRGRQHIA